MEVISKDNNLYILNEKEFVPTNIFENGQAFRWDKIDDGYFVVAKNYAVYIKKLNQEEIKELYENKVIDMIYEDVVLIKNGGTLKDYESFWRNYFDMDRDYTLLRESFIKKDKYLKEACEFGIGLRVLKQDMLEMIISFIISANNQIPRIKKAIEKISELKGEKIATYNGKDYYSFPTLDKLGELTVSDFDNIVRVGYRAKYLVKSIEMLKNNEISLDKIKTLPYDEAHHELCKLMGVGSKVADCILLFGAGKDRAFPVDTWVIKLMNEFYVDNLKSMKKIKEAGINIFGDKAGLAQQYLFFYARENKIGSKKGE